MLTALALAGMVHCHLIADWDYDVDVQLDMVVTASSLEVNDAPFRPEVVRFDSLDKFKTEPDARGFPYGKYSGSLSTNQFARRGKKLKIEIFEKDERRPDTYRAWIRGSAVEIPLYKYVWMGYCTLKAPVEPASR